MRLGKCRVERQCTVVRRVGLRELHGSLGFGGSTLRLEAVQVAIVKVHPWIVRPCRRRAIEPTARKPEAALAHVVGRVVTDDGTEHTLALRAAPGTRCP